MCEYLFESLFSVLLGVYFGIELLGHVIISAFEELPSYFLVTTETFLHAFSCVRVLVLPTSSPTLVTFCLYF